MPATATLENNPAILGITEAHESVVWLGTADAVLVIRSAPAVKLSAGNIYRLVVAQRHRRRTAGDEFGPRVQRGGGAAAGRLCRGVEREVRGTRQRSRCIPRHNLVVVCGGSRETAQRNRMRGRKSGGNKTIR